MQVFSLRAALQQPTQVTQLHLNSCGLQEVPPTVLRCPNLRVLNLSDNQLSVLPDWLPQLKQLEELYLGGNSLRNWTADWSDWRSLRVLRLSRNQLSSVRGARLPARLQQLDLQQNRLRTLALSGLPPSLLYLDLSGNALRQLPDLSSCIHLRQLLAANNRLREWPALPRSEEPFQGLQALFLAHNRLSEIPGTIARCRSLRSLELDYNCLSTLPPELGQLPWLARLSLGGNQLKTIPTALNQLERLDELQLNDNLIDEPINFGANRQLRRLDLSKNPMDCIEYLPASLRHLKLQGLRLNDWSFLRKLDRLSALELPYDTSESLLQALCQLTTLEVLRGVLPYGKKEKLLRLLQASFGAVEKRALIDFWIFSLTEKTDPLLLQKALLSQIAALRKQARHQLLGSTQEAAILELTRAVALVGRLETPAAELNRLLAERGIENDPGAAVAIIGRAPYADFDPRLPREWFSEAQLLAFLRKRDSDSSSWHPAALTTLKKRLLHPNPNQVRLALLLLDAQIPPGGVLPVLILATRLQRDPALQRRLMTLARRHATLTYERLLRTPFPDDEQLPFKEAVRRWGQAGALSDTDLNELLGLC